MALKQQCLLIHSSYYERRMHDGAANLLFPTFYAHGLFFICYWKGWSMVETWMVWTYLWLGCSLHKEHWSTVAPSRGKKNTKSTCTFILEQRIPASRGFSSAVTLIVRKVSKFGRSKGKSHVNVFTNAQRQERGVTHFEAKPQAVKLQTKIYCLISS